jgi:DNA (cytosine-5)-methyltransferase 1
MEPSEDSQISSDSVADSGSGTLTTIYRLKHFLEDAYVAAEASMPGASYSSLAEALGASYNLALDLGKKRHACRGAALTLCAYKAIEPTQDTRLHKAEHSGGFAARTYDNQVTVPFLARHGLKYNVETHWLSQSLSYVGPLYRGTQLKTQPPDLGGKYIELINALNEAEDTFGFARAAAQVILIGLIEERNKGAIALFKPKDLSIEQIIRLLTEHFTRKYDKNAPRLPQLAIYAIYTCLVPSMARYAGQDLRPLQKMKAADRKSGAVGDVDVLNGNSPVESVEVKLGIPIRAEHVGEAIEKIKTAQVTRYFILSTAGADKVEEAEIRKLQDRFKLSNGCEIIVNGVLETISYYLRLIRSPSDFIFAYTALLENDSDVGFDQRVAWNEICDTMLGFS